LTRARACVQCDHMKSRLVAVGNSRGVRLPKPLLEQAGLPDEVELEVRGNTIVIAPSRRPRAGWAEAAADLCASDGARLLDEPTSTRFDEGQWRW
jgi:antitoxin MazE